MEAPLDHATSGAAGYIDSGLREATASRTSSEGVEGLLRLRGYRYIDLFNPQILK